MEVDSNGNAGLEVNIAFYRSPELAAATKRGRQIAFVVNGKVVAVAVPDAPIYQRFLISSSFSKSDWEKLVR